MATPSKGGSLLKARRPGGSASKPPAPPSKPFLRVCHSAALHKKTLSVLASLEQAQDPTDHRDALADIVIELTASGLDYCFMRPLDLAKAGFIVRQSASLGMAGTQQVIGTAIRNIIGRMDRPQLLSVSKSIREMML